MGKVNKVELKCPECSKVRLGVKRPYGGTTVTCVDCRIKREKKNFKLGTKVNV